jgi:hypothetical protein
MTSRPAESPVEPRSPSYEPWPGYPLCPCGCEATGLKLAAKSGHLARLCTCMSCRNRGNRNRGQRGEARRHRRLGGEGSTPRDDLMHLYSINIATEDKVGKQIGATFPAFVRGVFATDAFRQAEKKIPVGSDALPALYLELGPNEWYLVIRGHGDRRTNNPSSGDEL